MLNSILIDSTTNSIAIDRKLLQINRLIELLVDCMKNGVNPTEDEQNLATEQTVRAVFVKYSIRGFIKNRPDVVKHCRLPSSGVKTTRLNRF